MTSKRIHIVLTTIFISILLWIYVKLEFQYQVTVNTALRLENLPLGKAVSSPLPRDVNVKFRGNGWQLVPLLMGPDPVLDVDAGLIGTRRVLSLREVTEQMGFPMGLQPIAMSPDTLILDLENQVQKKVPIIPDLSLSFRAGYGQIGEPTVTPDSVSLVGAESVLSRVREWRTQHRDFLNVRSPLATEIPLADTSLYRIRLFPTQTSINIDVQALAEKSFPGITIEVLNVPDHLEIIPIPPKVDITIRSGTERLGAVTSSEISVFSSYLDIIGDSSGTLPVQVYLPRAVQFVNKRPDQIQYIIRKRF